MPFPTNLDLTQIHTPCYIVDRGAMERNLTVLSEVQRRTGCRILLALKGFAMFSLFPQIRRHLKGASASSPHEARLAREEFDGEVHVYAPAYSRADLEVILGQADHLVFNSFHQWRTFREMVQQAERPISCGIRVNPEYSEVKTDLYNPCGRHSRLGVVAPEFRPNDLEGIEGLHFHALCEQNSDALAHTLTALEEKFGPWLGRMKWLNFGGGHHISRPDYDVDLLCRLVSDWMQRYGVMVYLEPGEAIALNTGILVTRVLDLVKNNMDIAILDTSAAAHMPDVLEMPYRPQVVGGGKPGEHPHTYRLGGLTCLAGDVIGDYSFPEPLTIGQPLIFLDMAHYTMVKNTTFNGVQLPDIAIHDPENGAITVVRRFGYEDYRDRLS